MGATFRSPKKNSMAQKSLDKLNGQSKILHKKDQHVYYNCFKSCSRALNNQTIIEIQNATKIRLRISTSQRLKRALRSKMEHISINSENIPFPQNGFK